MKILLLLILCLPLVAWTEKGLPLKQLLFIVIFLLTLYWFLLEIMVNGNKKIYFTKLHIASVLFIFYCFLNFFVAINNNVPPAIWIKSVGTFLPLLLVLPVSLYTINHSRINFLYNTYILSAMIVSAYALFILFGGGELTPTGTAGISASSEIWGIILVIPVLFSLKSKILTYKGILLRVLPLMIFLSHIILEEKRIAYGLTLLGAFIVFLAYTKFKNGTIFKLSTAKYIIPLVLIIIATGYAAYQSPRFSEKSIYRGLTSRYLIALAGMESFYENPILVPERKQ